MVDVWMPGASRRAAGLDGGSMVGGPARAVWHTTEGGSIAGAVSAMDSARSWSHVVWDPRSGEIVQMIGADRAARALEHPAGTPQTNRMGAVCVQIEVVGRAADPFTSGPLVGLERILGWLDGLGVPRVWPAGAPAAYPGCYGLNNGQRHPAVWLAKAGHYGHSQVPNNRHGDPGAVDVSKLTPPKVAAIEEAEMDLKNVYRRKGTEACWVWLSSGCRQWVGGGVFDATGPTIHDLVASDPFWALPVFGPLPPAGSY